MVQQVDVQVSDFYGRPDIYADIKGRLSSNAAQLVDTKQSRGKGNVIYVEVYEQTPLGGTGTNRVPNPPFQTRIPLEVAGLKPGQVYVVDANGAKTHFRMPMLQDDGSFVSSSMTSTSTGFELPAH